MPFGPDISYTSPEWEKIKAWLEQELQDTYKQLASLSVSADQTQQYRGRAAYIQKLLDLGTQLPATSR